MQRQIFYSLCTLALIPIWSDNWRAYNIIASWWSLWILKSNTVCNIKLPKFYKRLIIPFLFSVQGSLLYCKENSSLDYISVGALTLCTACSSSWIHICFCQSVGRSAHGVKPEKNTVNGMGASLVKWLNCKTKNTVTNISRPFLVKPASMLQFEPSQLLTTHLILKHSLII